MPQGKPGAYTTLGLGLAGPPGAAVGGALDIGSLVAEYLGGKEMTEEDRRRWEMEFGLARGKSMFEQERVRRAERRMDQLREALGRYAGRGVR